MFGAFRFVTINVVVLLFIIKLLTKVIEPVLIKVPPCPVIAPALDPILFPFPIDNVPAVRVNPPENVLTPVSVTVADGALITTAPSDELELSAIIPEYVEAPVIVSTPGNAIALDPVPVLNPKISFPEPEIVEALIPTRSNVVVPLVKFKALVNVRELLEVVIVPPVLVIVPVPT